MNDLIERVATSRVARGLGDWRLWAALAAVTSSIAVIVCLVWVVPAANDARREAVASRVESEAGRLAAEAVRSGNDAAACRSLFGGAATDARALLDDARAAHQLALGEGLGAAVDGNDRSYVLAVAARDQAAERINVARLDAARANQRYRDLLDAQTTDPARFRSMCAEGPGG